MKSLYWTVPFLLLSFSIHSQPCSTQNFHFNRQGQIDSFPILYPACSFIGGNVAITGYQITNLLGLSAIDSIGGFLSIRDCGSILDLNGLGSLKFVNGDLTIRNNSYLKELTGLDSLTTIGGSFIFDQNHYITDLSPLYNINQISKNLQITSNTKIIRIDSSFNPICSGDITISFNRDLISVKGLHQVKSVMNLYIEGNSNLSEIDGLDSLLIIQKDFIFTGNPNITHLNDLGALHTVKGKFKLQHSSLDTLEGRFKVGQLDIKFNNYLIGIIGFNRTKYLTGLVIQSNTNLQFISGFDSLRSVEPNLILENNLNLASISGFGLLNFVSGTFSIRKCPQLNAFPNVPNFYDIVGNLQLSNVNFYDLNCFSGLEFIHTFISIEDCPNLQSLSGLSNVLEEYIQHLTLQNNSQLSFCHLDNICRYFQSGKPYTISDNATGCNSFNEIYFSCFVDISPEPARHPIEVFPSPTAGSIHISSNGYTVQWIDLFDMRGQKIETWHQPSSEIRLTSVNPGAYMLLIHTDEGAIPKRIVRL